MTAPEPERRLALDGARLGALRNAVAHEIYRCKQDRRYWASREGGNSVADQFGQQLQTLEDLARDLL